MSNSLFYNLPSIYQTKAAAKRPCGTCHTRFGMIRDELNLNPEHRPHDGRKHFVTMAKKYGVDEYAIKYMVGHKISDITEKVYTQREFEWLKDEIEKIK